MDEKREKGRIHTEGSIASRLTSCLRGGRVFMLTDGEPEDEDEDDEEEGGEEGDGDGDGEEEECAESAESL